MDIEIDEVISRIRPVSGDSLLAPENMRAIVAAVVEAVEQRQQNDLNREEEQSMRNFQQRNQPWNR